VSSALALPANTVAVRAPSALVLGTVAGLGCAAAGIAVALAFTSDHLANPGVRAALLSWLILGYVLAGVVAWSRRPGSRLGPLMVAAGFATAVGSLAWSNAALPFTAGELFDFLAPVIFLHVFLAYPTGRLRSGIERGLVSAGYATAVGLELIRMLLGDMGPRNVLAVVDAPGAASAVTNVLLIGLGAISLAGIGVLALRRRKAGPSLRRSLDLLVNSFALGLVMIAVLFLSIVLEAPGVETTRRVTFGVIGIAPVVFLVALLRARLAHSAVGDLLVELRAKPAAPADLRDALARAVRDPSLTLAYWLPEYRSWADAEGLPVELPGAGSARALTVIDVDGVPVAALVHDRALLDEAELLESVRAAAGMALEHGRLQVELKARLDEVRGSRARIVAVTQEERQRLERNLHDGAQQRLIALSLDLGRLVDENGGSAGTRARLEEARREIAVSLEELRAVARGLHPAVVSGHGLEVALEQLAAGAPVPCRLEIAVEGRLPEPLEVAAYYLVSESLANVGKHARASAASIGVAAKAGTLVVEVVDDGVGGADTERGSGLRGLADRVEALGGSLRVWSPPDGGTRVMAEIPCGR
jgi:signal transduction histidine kinase